ncbi:hypothetical protein HHL19_18515 [Streptomyces sp. R302]|uniref:hypothetical protein n=1 Tax=unclassified Streptomyces TaxID=2593676 RepID=UPI00145CC6CF|nr:MULTISPECIES: hypothetical protein [unclassified Streptomyces]NML52461.1 hypothetical protein [Streptomyces sp. R301]NML80610.1 hypothetical protein [Streptomyces sp. R302]
MNRTVIGATGLALVTAVGIGGYAYLQQDEDVHVEALCNPTQSDAAEAARAQNLALVDVVERGRLVSKGTDAGMQTFKVRTLAVYKGTLPTEAEVGLPQASAAKLQPGSRYEVSVLGPEGGTWIARFTRPVPAGKTSDALAAHWKTEIGKQFVEPPCSDTASAP